MIKKIIHKTPLSKTLQQIRGKMDALKLVDNRTSIQGKKTVISISPYKTGTTFLARCYSPVVSLHEPMHYLSLKEVQKNFDAFVIQRQNTLNLKLECSGFWSAYIDELHDHPLADEFQYVCILRPPSSWIRSVVNHWVKIKKDMRYDYINELFWKQKVGVDLHQIPNLEGEAQNEQVKILEDFYFDYTNKTRKLDNVDYVWLSQIEEYLPVLNQKIDEVGDPGKSWKRGRSYKVFTYENEALDAEYEKLTSAFHMAIPK